MMKRLFVLALLPLAAHAETDFARQWPLRLAQPDAGAYRVPLDASVYAAAYWRDLRDVRVIDADGKPVASSVYAAAAPAPAPLRRVDLPWFALPAAQAAAADDLSVVVQRDADGKVVSIRNSVAGDRAAGAVDPAWLVDLGDDAGRLRALVVDWADADATFDLGYRLEASDDLRHWQVLDPQVRLVQLRNQDRRLSGNRIEVNAARRYLRLSPLQRSGAPRLRGLRGEIADAADTGDWQWQEARAVAGGSDSGAYSYRLDGRFPVQRLDVAMPANSTATWTVSSRDADRAMASSEPAWRVRASGWNTWHLSEAGQQQRSAPLQLDGATGDREWRLQAAPGTTLAEAPTLRFGYRPGSVVFLAQGRAPYLLVAGSANAGADRPALEPMLESLRARNGAQWQPAAASLGEGSVRAGDAAYRPAKAPRDWKNLVLWAVLVVGALVVAGFAFSLLRGKRPDPR
ncbi:DUF3999 domain-containing protein [Pseudoxanthomonas sangjuensis]|uniref:DUF3999 family protein n=1 Tax=Pseudoxanthomonas sangjuensis TaxID=1503750 RepID=UPI0013918D17|nr:DUF3999 family protein [Pseudoxanthomonas sangjuensis]KAF1706642.1 hypothetical protein CSC71_13975 [Pseudoxanthomonas sangjuensis]